MDRENDDLIRRNSVFGWIALCTAIVLLIPVIAMQFTSDVNWGTLDFIIMGVLLFATASFFVLISRRTQRRYRVVIGILLAGAFLLVWAELAVDLFSHLGS